MVEQVRPGVDKSLFDVDTLDRSSSSDNRDPPLPDDTTDWNYQAATAMLERLESLKVLSGLVLKQLDRKGREAVIREWADVFRLLQKQDGWSRDEITRSMQWLLQPDNRWIRNRWIQSATTLRQKTASGDKTKFEAILNQAQVNGTKAYRAGESVADAFERIYQESKDTFASG